jgi:hypothetical protein
VAFLLIGYLVLAQFFPQEHGPARPAGAPGPLIGQKKLLSHRPLPKTTERLPGGGEALSYGEVLPGDPPTLIIRVERIKAPTRDR